MSGQISNVLADCRDGLRILGADESVRYEIAHHFVTHTAYWDHPKGGWVQAPKHAERIVEGPYGWELSFGANCFLVGLALKNCIIAVSCFLREVEIDERPHYPSLLYDLKQCVRGAVGNHQGERYSGCYPEHGEFMLFGTQGIHLPSFTGIVAATARLPQHFAV
jgi:hypothetical protein